MLQKFQNSGTIGQFQTPSVISPNAIAFTSGFETNRGYPNNGYTSTTEKRSMAKDYDYLLNGLPEPLQVVLLDAVHNQSNLPGTILLALSKSSPNLLNELSNSKIGRTPEGRNLLSTFTNNVMNNVIILGRNQGRTPAYNQNNNTKLQMNLLKDKLLEIYNNNPDKFIDDFTKSRIERNSSFGSKNDKLSGEITKLQEWVERSLAAAQFAKDLKNNSANTPDYYYNQELNKGEFIKKSNPIVAVASQDFPGEVEAVKSGYYQNVTSAYDDSLNDINQKEYSNQPAIPSQRNMNNAVKSINNTTHPIYFDGTFYYTVTPNNDGTFTKQQVDPSGNPKLEVKPQQLDNKSASAEISKLYEVLPEGSSDIPNDASQLMINQNKPNFLNSLRQIGNEVGRGVSNLFRDKNPYQSQYQDEKQAIQEGQEMVKDFRQRNKAELKEDRLRKRDQNINRRLNKQADRNIFLQARKEERDATRKNKRLADEIENLDKLENRITRLQKRHQKKRNKIGVDQFKKGGIYIKPSKRGSFTAAADKRGMGVQEFASKVMTNKANYSPVMVKKANFARNAVKWKKQSGGDIQLWQETVPGFGTTFFQGVEGPERQNLVGSYYDNDQLKDPFGRNVTKGGVKSQVNKPNRLAQTPSQSEFKYDPKRLTTHGNRLQESALNRVTGVNIARFIGDQGRANPLIVSQYDPKRQVSTADFTPVYEQDAIARRNIAQNTRGTGSQLANLLQLNANLVRAKSDIARKNQLDQRGFDQAYEQQLAAKAAELAQAKRIKEGEDKADYAARQQFLTDTIEQSGLGDIERGKLYNQELRDFNTLQTYVNQLSPDYKVVMKRDGTKEVVFKNSGKPVPQAEFDKKVAEANQNKRLGGFMKTSKSRKKIRNRLY